MLVKLVEDDFSFWCQIDGDGSMESMIFRTINSSGSLRNWPSLVSIGILMGFGEL